MSSFTNLHAQIQSSEYDDPNGPKLVGTNTMISGFVRNRDGCHHHHPPHGTSRYLPVGAKSRRGAATPWCCCLCCATVKLWSEDEKDEISRHKARIRVPRHLPTYIGNILIMGPQMGWYPGFALELTQKKTEKTVRLLYLTIFL